MQYDPIKRTLGVFFNRAPWMRVMFYKMLDTLLLRTWHIKKSLKAIKNTLPAHIRVLDAGAGYGQYTYNLARLCKTWEICGVDVKTEQVADCNSFFAKLGLQPQVRFEVQDLTTFIRPEEFGLILSVDVMEHIEDDRRVFSNFYRSLTTNGILLISTPSDQGGSDAHDHNDDSFIEEHVRNGYSKEDITIKLQEAGFNDIEVKYSYGKPGKLSWRLSMKYPIQMLNISKIFFVLLPFYYLFIIPFCLILNSLDTYTLHNSGTGLIVKAKK
jgi:cyclopropane fatty-acyl-phospholipid synthase-like methyltransferase